MLTVREELDSPPGTAVFLVGLDVPQPWVVGFDPDDFDAVLGLVRNIEIPSVVGVLESPAVSTLVLNNLPLKSRSDQRIAEGDRRVTA